MIKRLSFFRTLKPNLYYLHFVKILSAQQTRELDKYTIGKQRISSVDLMERAAAKFTEAFTGEVKPETPVLVFCGLGNNGGDGLAVARLLLQQGYTGVSVFVVEHGKNKSPDFAVNEERLKKLLSIGYISQAKQMPRIKKGTVVIDALFGSGLNRRIEGIAAQVIATINKAKARVYSIDIPSGLFCDILNAADDVIVQSTLTITFHAPKLTFLLPGNEMYVPAFKVLDIGLDKTFAEEMKSEILYVDPAFATGLVKARSKFSHKGTYGHALIAAGSFGKIGAAVLSVKAALRSGAGLVSAFIPACGYQIMQVSNPEAMVLTGGEKNLEGIPGLNAFSAISIGPGIGDEPKTVAMLLELLKACKKPLVLDADALNILSTHKRYLRLMPAGSILTPHPGEFKRLVGEWKDDLDKLKKQLAFSKKYKVVIVLKGANTSVSSPEGELYFNSTGNAGMAKGGSGDVLTGIITAQMAQKYLPLQAAILGVFVHGLAGDLAKEALGETAMKAGDLTDYLPRAFLALGLTNT